MADWYGIDGIEFHFNGPWADPTITFDGVTDSACVDVEATMWDRYNDDGHTDSGEPFARYMREHAGEVRDLIRLARGDDDHPTDES